MKTLNQFLFLALVVTFLSSCGGSEVQKTSKKICACSAPMVEMMQKLNDTPDAEKAALMGEMAKIGEEFESCAGDIDKTMEEKGKDFEAKVEAELKKQCPDVAKMIEDMQGGMTE